MSWSLSNIFYLENSSSFLLIISLHNHFCLSLSFCRVFKFFNLKHIEFFLLFLQFTIVKKIAKCRTD